MLTPQQIKEIEEKFDDGFREQLSVVEADMIKSFIITTINIILAERDNNVLIKHIDSEIERLENIIPPYPADKENPLKHAYQNQGYIQATQDTVKSLKAELTKSK